MKDRPKVLLQEISSGQQAGGLQMAGVEGLSLGCARSIRITEQCSFSAIVQMAGTPHCHPEWKPGNRRTQEPVLVMGLASWARCHYSPCQR